MRRQQLARRRHWHRHLAQIDAANRCAQCKRALTAGQVQRFGDPTKFCSTECAELAAELEAMREARRQ